MLFSACPVRLTLPSLSALLRCWLDEVTLMIAFTSVQGFPLGCEGPHGSSIFLQMGSPSPLPSLSEAVCNHQVAVFVERVTLSLTPSPPARGSPAPPPSNFWLHWSLRCLLCCVDVLCWDMNVFFIVLWRGEFTGKELTLP